jgi:hypothetical protein
MRPEAIYCKVACKRAARVERNRRRLQTPELCLVCSASLAGRRADRRACPGECSRQLIYAEHRTLYLARRRERRLAAKVLVLPVVVADVLAAAA